MALVVGWGKFGYNRGEEEICFPSIYSQYAFALEKSHLNVSFPLEIRKHRTIDNLIVKLLMLLTTDFSISYVQYYFKKFLFKQFTVGIINYNCHIFKVKESESLPTALLCCDSGSDLPV